MQSLLMGSAEALARICGLLCVATRERPSRLLRSGADMFAKRGSDCWKERKNMCQCKDKCRKPDQLKGEPKDCSPEQIKKCHGDAKEHPCVKMPEDK